MQARTSSQPNQRPRICTHTQEFTKSKSHAMDQYARGPGSSLQGAAHQSMRCTCDPRGRGGATATPRCAVAPCARPTSSQRCCRRVAAGHDVHGAAINRLHRAHYSPNPNHVRRAKNTQCAGWPACQHNTTQQCTTTCALHCTALQCVWHALWCLWCCGRCCTCGLTLTAANAPKSQSVFTPDILILSAPWCPSQGPGSRTPWGGRRCAGHHNTRRPSPDI